jgi:hypothetical protein
MRTTSNIAGTQGAGILPKPTAEEVGDTTLVFLLRGVMRF